MKVLVAGSTGMLGQALVAEAAGRGFQVEGVSRTTAPISLQVEDTDQIARVIGLLAPDLVINAIADVSLVNCQKDPGQAYCINARPAAYFADACRESKTSLIQISTDHFYSGDGRQAHTEDASITLKNEYARSKYAAEMFALTCPGALVVRTNIVGFRGRAGRPTFVEWVFASLLEGRQLTLFEDYFTSSLDVKTCARAIFDLAAHRAGGTVNVASRQVASKKEFIECLAEELKLELVAIAGSVHADPSGPPRADSGGLDVSKAESLLGWRLPNLREVIGQLVREYREREPGISA